MGAKGDKGAFRSMERACGLEPQSTLTLIDKAVKKGNPAVFVEMDRFADDVVQAFATHENE